VGIAFSQPPEQMAFKEKKESLLKRPARSNYLK
jgi:hypothetical protein